MEILEKIPIGLGEQRVLDLRGMFFNAFNHTQFQTMDVTARYNPAGQQTNGTFGAYNSSRLPRQISLTLRFEF